MRVIIAGAGEIGCYIAEKVSAAGHDVIIIDNQETTVQRVDSDFDVNAISGGAASAETLLKAGVAESDLFVAVTGSDETNLVSASVAAKLGARRTVARVDEVVYRKAPEISYSRHFNIDCLISPEMLTALGLASVVRNPGALAVEHFAAGELEMQQLVANEGAAFVGRCLYEIELPVGVRVASIRQHDKLVIPRGDDVVRDNDVITIVGQTDQLAVARAGFEAGNPKPQKIVIMGGGHIALSMARRLRGGAYRLTIIERQLERCQLLATLLPDSTIVHGDGTRLALLQEERVDNASVFISTTRSDETNIMSAMRVKDLGVEKVLVVIHRPDYTDLMEKMGIYRAVSPRAVMAREMLMMLGGDKVGTLAELDGAAVILQMPVEAAGFVGKRLSELPMPAASLVLTLQRDRQIIIPDADTEFLFGDIVLVICQNELKKKIGKLIVG